MFDEVFRKTIWFSKSVSKGSLFFFSFEYWKEVSELDKSSFF